MANVISRQIGGVYVDRLFPEQQGETAPYRAIPLAKQRAAMQALADHVYSPDAFALPADLAARLQPQRRGFDFGGETEDPKIHERVLNIQTGTLNHLLNPVVLQRMVNSSLYGNEYLPVDMIMDLNTAIFGDDLRGTPNSFRRNLQVAYTERLVAAVDDPSFGADARSAVLAAIDDVNGRFGMFDFNLDPATKAHRAQIKRIIAGLDAE